jgi:hypothetical protein
MIAAPVGGMTMRNAAASASAWIGMHAVDWAARGIGGIAEVFGAGLEEGSREWMRRLLGEREIRH